MLVLGDKEAESGLVTVRDRKEGDIGNMALDEFVEKLADEVNEKL